jgi:WD40 repeat protein
VDGLVIGRPWIDLASAQFAEHITKRRPNRRRQFPDWFLLWGEATKSLICFDHGVETRRPIPDACSVGVAPAGHLVAIASRDGTVELCRSSDGGTELRFVGSALSTCAIRSLTFSPDGRTLAAQTEGFVDLLFLWETSTGRELLRRNIERFNNGDITFSEDGRWLAVSGNRKNAEPEVILFRAEEPQ